MKLPNFILEVSQGDAIKRLEFARPTFKVIKLVSSYITNEDTLGAGLALIKNTAVSGCEGLEADPSTNTAVAYELYHLCIESIPEIELVDNGTFWGIQWEGEVLQIAKPSMEAIRLASKARNQSVMHAGEVILVDGLSKGSSIWDDGLSLAGLAIAAEKAFSKSLPKVKRLSLGER